MLLNFNKKHIIIDNTQAITIVKLYVDGLLLGK